nr:Nif11-like leader peptide family natural product precursor [uncultured Desulfobulbus sp.]
MAKAKVEELLIAGGSDEKLRNKYDVLKTKEEFIAMAKEDGFEFTVEELDAVLRESGDAFESFGNPPKRMIWWQ